MRIQHVVLGVALAEVDHGVREEGGNNTGPRIRQYLANTTPPIHVAAPWCAAFVQYVADVACRLLDVPNPLDSVKLEAYVQSYYNWAVEHSALVGPEEAQAGDLVLYDFRGKRWDHIGILLSPVDMDAFRTVEGNTSDSSQRDGDAAAIKGRRTDADYPVCFVRWAP